MITPLVTAYWLAEQLHDPELVILEVNFKSKVTRLTSFEEESIENARFFDLKTKFSDQNNTFPNTLPSAQQFEKECRKLGICTNSKIVVYDKGALYASPRIWWMFRIMGHEKVAVLDGGLNAWKHSGYKTISTLNQEFVTGNFIANYQPKKVKEYNQIIDNIVTEEAIVIDARSSQRFNGLIPEPRKELRSGHIPKSINIPYTEMLNNGIYKSKVKLDALFKKYSLQQKPLIFSCGSGITACIVLLAAEMVLSNKKAIYDGSWTEFCQKEHRKL